MSIFDEHVLQYSRRGQEGECELVIGLDFGTSASKVVIQAPQLPGSPAYAVDFGDLSYAPEAHLLPTRLWVTPKGACSLDTLESGRLVNDIKLELFSGDQYLNSKYGPAGQRLAPEAVAVAYLGLVLRYTRTWFLETHHNVVGNFKTLNWSLNLGVPSPSIDNKEENQRFKRVGKAAWMLSVMEEEVTIGKAHDELRYLLVAPEYWDRDDDGLACDFAIVPEIAAGAVGYALSEFRREGLHVIVDIGASTVDVCSFVLHESQGSDHYGLLTADVQQLGTIRLHHERILAIERVFEKQAENLRDKHDPLAPIAEDIASYLLSHEQIVQGVQRGEAAFKDRFQSTIRGVITHAKVKRDPSSSVWRGRLPILLIGGGSKSPLFHSLVNDLGAWVAPYSGNKGIFTPPVPMPKTLSSKMADSHRLVVAWGLSHPALDIGEITPVDRMPDIKPTPRRNWKDNFISKDQV